MSRDALIVGINNYNSQRLNNLKAPAEEAEAIAFLLEKYGDFKTIRRLPEAINKEINKPYVAKTEEVSLSLADLEDALSQLFNPKGRNIPDTALFYFSGHGLRKTKGGVEEGFLATSNIKLNEGFYGLSLQWLRRLLQESPIKQQIIWLDCCHSGEILNFNEANPGESGKARDRCFIAASREFEKAYIDLKSPYGVLTKVLLEGLNPERCPQEWVTNISLTDYIDRHLQDAIQTPLFTNFGQPINLTRTWEVSPQTTESEVNSDICPYKGLEYFDCNEEDPKYFYGREQLTDQLIDKVRQSNFIAIVGASGSGKSSVMRAGLLHQLKQGRKLSGSSDWEIKILVPGEHPMENLALSLIEPNLSRIEKAKQFRIAKEELERGATALESSVKVSDAPKVIIVVDQFEEVFTLCQDIAERKLFLECILGAVEKAKGKLGVILAMRADFFGKCLEQEYSGLGRKIEENLVSVTPMNQKQLREAIASPAKRVNLQIESELIEEMLRDIEGAPGNLPLLQYTLTQLWERKTDNQLKLSDYSFLGGIVGTLNKRATEVYQQFSPEKQDIAKHIFLCLTQLGEDTEDTRRRISWQDLLTEKYCECETLIEEVVQKLADERLIVTQEDNSKSTIIDVAHEALIRHWQELRGWLDESRDALRKQREIERDAKNWQDHGKFSDYLWLGFKLKEAEKLFQDYCATVSLSNLTQEFLEACRNEELRNYLQSPEIDWLDYKALEKEATVKSFLTKKRLRNLLDKETETAKVRLAASWLLKQWGEKVPTWKAKTDAQQNISLHIIKPPPTVVENLGNGIKLEMVEIPSGEFWMGSPKEEKDSYDDERPQHKVTVSPFLMGKYPITQKQWKAVASLPQIERELKLKPSYFEGDNCPVECVSWYDAVEFCKRLSLVTGKDYRLPSEAQWEYACRSDPPKSPLIRGTSDSLTFDRGTSDSLTFDRGTSDFPTFNRETSDSPTFERETSDSPTFNRETSDSPTFERETSDSPTFNRETSDSPLDKGGKGGSPFHFGKTISPYLANYSQASRGRTTPVERFQVANAFGLYDMNGNVWEFCQDDWHDNYEGAPEDGTAWLSETEERIVIRGGSFVDIPRICRSAYRDGDDARDVIGLNLGFRVVCVLPRLY